MRLRAACAAFLLAACATGGGSPFDDIARAQQRLDQRGLGFGVTRVPGHDAFVFQLRFAVSDASTPELLADPMAAAQAAAPEGCTVTSVTPQEGGESYRAEYDCG